MDRTIKQINLNTIKNPNRYMHIFMILASGFFFLFMLTSNIAAAKGFSIERGDFKGYHSYEGNAFPDGPRGEEGNGATGGIAALLLVFANVTVLLSLILKGINKFFSLAPETKTSISEFNKRQKRYLRGMHYILNPIAICVAVIHYHLSSCRSILPDMALFLFLIIGLLGLLIKLKLSPAPMHKMVYGFHCSSATFFALILLLAIGHA
jgi:cytochrome bd-type quinol oxidase subunit 2